MNQEFKSEGQGHKSLFSKMKKNRDFSRFVSILEGIAECDKVN